MTRIDRPGSHTTPAEWNFASHFLDRDGLRLHYLDEGRGDPVVMVHGNPSWSYYYRRLVSELRTDHRCIVPDHIGCGLSDKPDDSRYEYTLRRRVDDLEALLEHLGLRENLTLVLHDWGGMIGLAFAERHPERVSRLVLLNTAGFGLPTGRRLPRTIWWGRNTPLGPLLIRGLNAFCLGAARYCTVRPLAPAVRRQLLAPYDSWKNRIAVLRFVQDIPLQPGDPAFEIVQGVERGLHRWRTKPVLICWGERDFVFDHAFLAEWRRRLPEAEVQTFPNAGHYVLEDAGDEIAGRIRGFLTRPAVEKPPAVNIATTLVARAAEQPETPSLIVTEGRDAAGRFRSRTSTFRDLDADTDRIAHGLERIGIGRGVRTVLMVPPSYEFYALTFALFKVGAVVVLIDPGMGVRNLGVCLAEAAPEAFIGVPKAHLGRLLYRWGHNTLRVQITVGRRWGWGGWTLDGVRQQGRPGPYPVAPTAPDELAAILFTSGSTGVAKGAEYTHSQFAAQVEVLRNLYGIAPGEIDLPTFPLFGLFGPALGMTAVLPEMDATRPANVDPDRILGAIRQFGVTNLFGSPALLRRLAEHSADTGPLPTLRRVLSAGAPVPARILARFATRLSTGVRIHTPYGATEALPVATISSEEILAETAAKTEQGAGTCVGRPAPGIELRIIRISDKPIEQWDDSLTLAKGEIGEIVVRGAVASRAYFGRPESTLLAKISDPSRGFWHRMGDVGYFDDQGRLWFCGRKSQRVVLAEQTLFTIPCEGVFNAHPAVRRSALVGVPRDGVVEPVLCVEREPDARSDDATLTRELLALGTRYPHTARVRTILFHPAFPVDIRHNAKIFREKLAAWAAERLR